MEKKLNVLVLSSRMPSYSANFGEDVMSALRNAGHSVTYNFKGAEDIISSFSCKRKQNKLWQFIHRCRCKFYELLNMPLVTKQGYIFSKGYIFFMGDEENEKNNSEILVSKIEGSYDLVICLYFQDMFTMKTLELLYNKLKCPILIYSIDMYPMTGGCYYFNECRGFENDCQRCPAFNWNLQSLASRNFVYKKKVYKEKGIYLGGNTWQIDFIQKSNIIPKEKIYLMPFVLNENFFIPQNIEQCRKEIGISTNKKLIFLERHCEIKRKGNDFLLNALNIFLTELSERERDGVLLLTIGEQMSTKPMCDILELGYIDSKRLVSAYNAASAFLCSSIDDAGPSMINQSIACGTPVVAFNSGASLDVIELGISGYKAKFKDVDDFAKGLKYIANLSESELMKLRASCRQQSLKWNSLRSFSDRIESFYDNLSVNQ